MQPGTTSTNASNLRTVVTSANSLTLMWTPPAAGIECRLSRSLSGGDFAALPPISQGTSQYVDTAPTLLNQRPEYRIACGDAKSLTEPLRFPRPEWDPTGPVATAPESSSPTAATNLKAAGSSSESVTLMWGPPTNPIACSIRRSLNGGAYTVITTLPIGTWQYVDTLTGLSTMRPRYQIACGDPKTGTVVSFANPVFR